MSAAARYVIDPPPHPFPPRGKGALLHVGLRISAALLGMLASASPICAGEAFAVSGSVRSASGTPLSGVAVSVDGGSPSTITDAAGTFRLLVAGGDHRLRPSHPGYATLQLPLPVPPP